MNKTTLKFIGIALFLGPISRSLSAQNTDIYFETLCKKGVDPKEYIFKAFENVDVVILGERDHRDTTQYNLILDILSDPRFANQIGHVYTEVGVINMTEEANRLIKGRYASDEEFHKKFIEYYRNEDFNPLWDKSNRYMFINGLYKINSKLPRKKKITLGLTDLRFEWSKMKTSEQYQNFNNSPAMLNRDSTMAAHFMDLYQRQKPIKERRKALLITNQPHAIKYYYGNNIYTEGHYLSQRLHDNLKIVLLNWYNWWEEPSTLCANGGWDAAFEKYKKQPVAIDLKNTPYGKDKKDGSITSWEDIADGLIFYTPFYKFIGAIGIPNAVDDTFANEIIRRDTIVSPTRKSDIENLKTYYNEFRTFKCCNEEELMEQLKKAETQE